jgi:hypothetical protein
MRIIEVGMHWFPEGGGGADRYFHGLVLELFKSDPSARALVFGEGSAEGEQVRFLGSRKQSLPERLKLLRKGMKQEMSRGPEEPMLVASHFALYGLPVLDILLRHTHVVHFHGPWAYESEAEGESSRSVFFKRAVERVPLLEPFVIQADLVVGRVHRHVRAQVGPASTLASGFSMLTPTSHPAT